MRDQRSCLMGLRSWVVVITAMAELKKSDADNGCLDESAHLVRMI